MWPVGYWGRTRWQLEGGREGGREGEEKEGEGGKG